MKLNIIFSTLLGAHALYFSAAFVQGFNWQLGDLANSKLQLLIATNYANGNSKQGQTLRALGFVMCVFLFLRIKLAYFLILLLEGPRSVGHMLYTLSRLVN
jgi:hypothetical protein